MNPDPIQEQAKEPPLRHIKIHICQPCLDAVGDECHTPGCALFLHKVDLRIPRELYEDITPTHAPSEGQTGETPETDMAEFGACPENGQEQRVVFASFARQLEAQRDSARKERDAAIAGGPPEGWPVYAENLARKLGEMTRERDNAIASHSRLEAQLAGMREQIDSRIASNVEKDSKSFSGQALLDRLNEMEKALQGARSFIVETPIGGIWRDGAIATAQQIDKALKKGTA